MGVRLRRTLGPALVSARDGWVHVSGATPKNPEKMGRKTSGIHHLRGTEN
jgi:hypothetical protein